MTTNKLEEIKQESTAIPKLLIPYINKYGENAKEFSLRYEELKNSK